MKLKKSTVIPLILFLYLCGMSFVGLKSVQSGETSFTTYILTIAVTLAIIITLHFFMKKREKLRDERLKDIRESEKSK